MKKNLCSSSGSNGSHQGSGNALNSADFYCGVLPRGRLFTMPASQKFEPKDPWGRPFIMPENVGLYCVLFPMGLLLIPVFTATGNYTGGAAGARARSRKGERLCRDVFSFLLSFLFPSSPPFPLLVPVFLLLFLLPPSLSSYFDSLPFFLT